MRARVAGAGGCAMAVVLAGACAPKRVEVGGVVVRMQLDGTLQASDLSALAIEVDAPGDAGRSNYRRTFEIQRDTFPASFAIESNGNPTASATIRLTLLAPSGTVDARQYQLVDIPVTATTTFDVIFSRACAPGKVSCGAGNCCVATAGSAGCSGVVVPAQEPKLTCTIPDGGVPEASLDAGDARDATTALDAPGAEDSSVEASASLDAPAGYDGATSCNPPCVEGTTHCVGTQCVAVPPSCAGGGPGAGFNCGGYAGTEDCCATLDVPLKGQATTTTFYRDYDGTNYFDQSNPARVSQFSLDVYEVTVGRFRKFVSAVVGADGGAPWLPDAGSGRHTHLDGGGLNAGGTSASNYEKGWDPAWSTASNLPSTKAGWDALLTTGCPSMGGTVYTWTSEPSQDPQNPSEILPIVCVDWYTAYAFCIWDGGFLPSVTEWDCAAAGGQSQRVYAWGDNPPDESNSYAIYNCLFKQSPTGACWNYASNTSNVAAVGYATQGQGLWGQMDLSGSAFEWTLDLYDGTYPNPCTDCANFTNGALRRLRGGGFDSPLGDLYVSKDFSKDPTWGPGDTGIRCARPPY